MVARIIEVTRRGRKGEQGNPGPDNLAALTTGGSSTVYTITNASPVLSYDDGYGVTVKAHATSGATPTANVDTLGAKPIKKLFGGSVVAIAAGDMVINQFYVLHYSSDADALLLFGTIATSFARTLLDDVDAAEARATLGAVGDTAWEPLDDVYDFAVDGALASIETAAFEDGYEYMFHPQGVECNLTAEGFQMELYGETAAAYHPTPVFLSGNIAAADDTWGWVELTATRIISKLKRIKVSTHADANIGPTSDGQLDLFESVGDTITADAIQIFGTAQKISKARFSWTGGNLNGGIIAAYRRVLT